MLTIVFEDDAAGAVGVLTAARPACDLTIGSMTLVDALRRFGTVRRAARPNLMAYLAAVGSAGPPQTAARRSPTAAR